MLYFKFNAANELTAVSESPSDHWRGWISRWDIKNLARASEIAAQATALTGELHIADDQGSCVTPRYDVVIAPKIGDKVSYAFNGDYYPDGTIVHVTPGTLRVIKTSTGKTYYKRGDKARWIQTGGTWTLVSGHHDRRNPEF